MPVLNNLILGALDGGPFSRQIFANRVERLVLYAADCLVV